MKNRSLDRHVVFDVAPVLADADAISLVPLVGHIVFVAEWVVPPPGTSTGCAAVVAGEDPGPGLEPAQAHKKSDVVPQLLPQEVRRFPFIRLQS